MNPPLDFEVVRLSSDTATQTQSPFLCVTKNRDTTLRLTFPDRPLIIGSPQQIAKVVVGNQSCSIASQSVASDGSYLIECVLSAEQMGLLHSSSPTDLVSFEMESMFGVKLSATPRNPFTYVAGW